MDDIQLNELQESLYQSLGGDKVGTRKEFYDELVSDDNLRRTLYNDIGGRKVGTYAEFIGELGFNIKGGNKTNKTVAKEPPTYETPEDIRRRKVKEITNKYDKDREQMSYSLYNEGVDKKKVKGTVEPNIQMPQDVLKTPDLGKAKFVKDWTDKKIADAITIEDALTLNPKEAYRVTKGAHAIDVDNKLIELTDQNKWGVINELQKGYAGFIEGYSNSIINADNTDEEKELVRQAVDVAIKKADASGEIIKKNIETKYLNNHINLLSNKANNILDKLITPDELSILNNEAEYTKAVNEGSIARDGNYEKVLNTTKQKLQSTGFYDLSNTIDISKQELEALPIEYKKAAIADKAQQDLQNYRDAISKKKGDLANGFLSFSDAFDSAVERNFLKGIPNSIMAGLASAGVDFGEAWVAAESVQPGILNLTTTKNLRPSFEKSAVYHDPTTGISYEIGFSDKDQVSEIYDKNGYVAVLSDEEKQRIAENVEKAKLYKKAKTNINGESLAYKGISTALDVGATVAMGYGMAKGLQLAKLGSEAGALAKLGTIGTTVESQLLQGVPMFMQYWGNSTVDAVRSGELAPQEAAWYGAATTAMEVAIEGLNPLMGRVSKGLGRISQTMESLERRNVLAALEKYTTRQARQRGLVSILKDMGGEQGEEILSLYTTPVLNSVANQVLDGNFDTNLPSAEDWYETLAITTMATIIPATFSGVNDFNYLQSDKFFKESLYSAVDLKYKGSLESHLNNLEKDGTITTEEKNKFNGLIDHLRIKKPALDELGDNTDKSKILRENIVGLYAQIYGLEQKKSNDDKLDEPIQSKINIIEKQLTDNISKLRNISPSIVQSEELPDQNATNQDNKEGVGENSLNLPITIVDKVAGIDKQIESLYNKDNMTNKELQEAQDREVILLEEKKKFTDIIDSTSKPFDVRIAKLQEELDNLYPENISGLAIQKASQREEQIVNEIAKLEEDKQTAIDNIKIDENGNVIETVYKQGEQKQTTPNVDWSAEQQRIENDKTLSPEQKEKAKIESTAKALEDLNVQDFDKLTPKQKAELYKKHGIKNTDGSEITEKDIEADPLQYSYDFMASSNSGKWNSANSELESAVQGNKKQSSLYKLMLGEFDTFKEFVDFINSKNYGDKIEYTERMKRADDMSPEERKSAIDSYNKSVEDKADDKAQKQKDILNEHGFEDEKEYSPQEIINKFPLKGVQKIIYDIIKNVADKLGIKVKFSSSRITEGFEGSNNPLNGEILISPQTLKNGRIGEVLVHEVVHALTTKIISRVNSGVETGLSTTQIAAVKGLNKLYEAVRRDTKLENKYPVKDIFEFIAHLTNDNFVKELESKDRNFLQKVVDFIADILGISNANELAKKHLRDIISDGTFLEKEGITVKSSDYAANTKGAKELTPREKLLEKLNEGNRDKAEAYHKAKADGSNPELVKAVEDLFGKPKERQKTKITEEGKKENPLNLDIPSLPKDIAGRKEVIKTKLQNDGILVFEDENGNPC